ncbi:uncharacterized protein LOC119089795 [Pollicipes pollicipes]|uniref:uncharacterized protein LOC119089795 n=1 Tax=Pollicipes pollicipes TaxID=41117 RepID=UPI001884C4BA|nr:uncharacterized protein LOC119089795 [Pollicipes pollicipes]
MLPKAAPDSPEYANIDSCASSCGESDLSAPSGAKLNHAALHVAGELHTPAVVGKRSTCSASRRPIGRGVKMRTDALKSAKMPAAKAVAKRENASSQSKRSSGHADGDSQVHQGALEADKENVPHVSRSRRKKLPSPPVFGYDIDDINNFLSQATARTPANIPMVVTSRTELYVLTPAATPEEPTVPIHLGLVVNALFKHRQWLYVQTPHSQEGYLAYSACTPLGVIPRGSAAWEVAGDLYLSRPLAAGARSPPPPDGDRHALDVRVNKTDSEKLYENVTSDGRALGLLVELHLRRERARGRQGARSHSTGREPGRRRSPPRRDHNNKAVIWDGFVSCGRNTLTVKRGDIVILLNTSVGDWFWVKDVLGREGYIPSVCVGSGLK